MRIINIMLLTAIAVLFSACGPSLAPPLVKPAVPESTTDVVEVPLKWENDYDLKDNVAYLRTHKVKVGSSVVLNVPASFQISSTDEDDNQQEFKTADFFSVAEQQIERGLLNSGFRVISRAKFEAKLRSLRDQTECETLTCVYKRATPEMRILMDEIADQYKNKQISDEEYLQKVAYFKEKLNDTAGKKRDAKSKELTDISEVIRAAGSAGVKADYILQINAFDTNKKFVARNNLNSAEKVRAFVRKHPGIKDEFENGNNIVECKVIGAVFNAKLIHVATGEIVWIGENKINELASGVNNITIEMGARTYVANEREVDNFIANNNTMYARELRFGRETKVPEWRIETSLIKPVVTSGICERLEHKEDSQKSLKLARKVAKELIATIKTVDDTPTKPLAPGAVAKSAEEIKAAKKPAKEPVKTVDVKI